MERGFVVLRRREGLREGSLWRGEERLRCGEVERGSVVTRDMKDYAFSCRDALLAAQ